MSKNKTHKYILRILWVLCAITIVLAIIVRYIADIVLPIWVSSILVIAIFTLAAAALCAMVVFKRKNDELAGIFCSKLFVIIICWLAVLYGVYMTLK